MPKSLLARTLSRVVGSFYKGAYYETCYILGHECQLRPGTFRSTPDYDDAWLLACAGNATWVFDVGANVGYDALLALMCPQVKGIALIEANPEALVMAADNLIRNGLSIKAHFVPAFASDVADEKVTFWTTGVGAAGSMWPKHAVTAALQGESMEVPTITLDVLCGLLSFSPDLVKIDVEGAEGKVLGGSRGLAAKERTRFMVEMHSNPDLPMGTNAQGVIDWCRDVEYSAWYLTEHSRLDCAEQIATRGRCHVLLQPAKWPYPDWLRGIEQSAPLEVVRHARDTGASEET